MLFHGVVIFQGYVVYLRLVKNIRGEIFFGRKVLPCNNADASGGAGEVIGTEGKVAWKLCFASHICSRSQHFQCFLASNSGQTCSREFFPQSYMLSSDKTTSRYILHLNIRCTKHKVFFFSPHGWYLQLTGSARLWCFWGFFFSSNVKMRDWSWKVVFRNYLKIWICCAKIWTDYAALFKNFWGFSKEGFFS